MNTKAELELFRQLLNELIELNEEASGITEIRSNIRRVNKKWHRTYNNNKFIVELFKRIPLYAEEFKVSDFEPVN